METTWFTFVGYAGSFLIAVSLSMTNIWRLRWINLIGASTFATYGLLIGAWPVVALNSCITLIDVYHLVRLSRRRDEFSFFEIPVDAPFLLEFLRFYRDDIARFFPSFDLSHCSRAHVRLILRNMMPVGVFVCDEGESGTAVIQLDYVVPGYRDFKNARFVYSATHARLRAAGLHTFVATAEVPAHEAYLRRLGFARSGDQPQRFSRPV